MPDDVQSRSVMRRKLAMTPELEGKIKLLFRQCIRRARINVIDVPEEDKLVEEFAGLLMSVLTLEDSPLITGEQRDLLVDLAAWCEDFFKPNAEEGWGREAAAALRLATGSLPGYDSEGVHVGPNH